jgi:hypothetical protein
MFCELAVGRHLQPGEYADLVGQPDAFTSSCTRRNWRMMQSQAGPVNQGTIYVLSGNVRSQVSLRASDRYAEVGWANRLIGELHSCF